jgi:hypothetical protein
MDAKGAYAGRFGIGPDVVQALILTAAKRQSNQFYTNLPI